MGGEWVLWAQRESFSPRLTVSIFFHLPNKGVRRSSFPVLLLSKPKKKMRKKSTQERYIHLSGKEKENRGM
jgi:hypothetical protein